MMKRTTLREKLVQVVLCDDNSFSIEVCDECDNFDEHGCDYEIPIEGLDQAKSLLKMLTEAIRIAEL